MTDESFELAMPFLCVESKGGPYPDGPFVAGVMLGMIYQATYTMLPSILQMVYPPLVPTIDLIAMKHGYKLTTYDHGDEWTEVALERVNQ